MGAIAGVVDYGRDLLEHTDVMDKMLQRLKHRGPDAYGVVARHNALLGARRLPVSDPAVCQPMSRSIGSHAYTLVLSGDVFNAGDLRQQLMQKGYAFTSHSDTEVLLNAYIEWGPSCVDQLYGMYAFAVWEEHRQRLFLARDRMGAVPLFYSIRKSTLVFASEIKALFCHGDVTPMVDGEGLLELFALAPARTPGKTPFKYIRELRPGECMTFSQLGVYRHRYWQYTCARHTETVDETAEHLGCLVRDAIKRQLSADAPVCAFLSGGLDSSLISAAASRELASKGERLSTYSIRFPQDEKYFSETLYQPHLDGAYVGTMTDFLKSDHIIYTIDLDEMANALSGAVEARDLPGMGDVDSSMLLLCREAAKGFTVALSGECADEIFGGYPWYHNSDLLRADGFPWARSLSLRRSIMHKDLEKLPMEAYAHERFMETAEETPVLKEENEETRLIRRMVYINVKWFMTNLLDRQDRMGMASGLEIRAPFCDHRIAEYAWNIPWDTMNYGGMEKGILRLSMKGLVPQSVLERKKSPYPKTHHPDYVRKVSALLQALLDGDAPLKALVDTAFVRMLLNNPGNIVTPWYGQLMTAPQLFAFLIQMDIWLRKYGVILAP